MRVVDGFKACASATSSRATRSRRSSRRAHGTIHRCGPNDSRPNTSVQSPAMTKVPEPMVMENTDGSLAILQPPEQWPDGTQIDVDSLTRRLESHLGTYDARSKPACAGSPRSRTSWRARSPQRSIARRDFRKQVGVSSGVLHLLPAAIMSTRARTLTRRNRSRCPYTVHFSRVIYQPDRKDKRSCRR